MIAHFLSSNVGMFRKVPSHIGLRVWLYIGNMYVSFVTVVVGRVSQNDAKAKGQIPPTHHSAICYRHSIRYRFKLKSQDLATVIKALLTMSVQTTSKQQCEKH